MVPPSGTLPWALWFLGELAFKWVPGTVVSIAQGNLSGMPSAPAPSAVIDPVSGPDVVQYLQSASTPGTYDQLFNAWGTFVTLSMLISLALFAVVAYCLIRMFQVREMELRRFATLQEPIAARDVPKTALRWNRILEETNSDSERSWRLAILEADIMLNEMLDTLGYRGETMADKMRSADKSEFHTLDLAWEAHRFRNTIAHEGTAFALSAREARRVIGLYERVFKEFKIIE